MPRQSRRNKDRATDGTDETRIIRRGSRGKDWRDPICLIRFIRVIRGSVFEFGTSSMAKTPDRVLDVWIVETQAVYTDVPFAVVTDWVQQGRLLADDRVRLAGN